MSCPSLSLTLWSASWLAGHAGADDVLDALAEWAPMHLVAVHPTGDPEVGAATLLPVIRAADPAGVDGVRLVLPAAGDVRGLPPGTEYAAAAVAAGEGVLVGAPGTPGVGIVPTAEGPDVLRWNVFRIGEIPGPDSDSGLGEAEYAMRDAVREAARALAGVQTVGGAIDPRAAIAEETAAHARHRYPDTLPPRAARILDTADQVAAILTVAEGQGGLPAMTASGAAARDDALRPLWAAVRAARIAVVAATVREVHGHRPGA